MEFIDATEISPLISHCNVKVCYVSDKPNRNGTVITKEVATDMGKKLPGSPVVGYFNDSDSDFEGHNRDIVCGKEFKIVDMTQPYGFVPTDAKVWFQKFQDDTGEHEYLVTECYLWTTAYPDVKRVIEKGNNQSMELNDKNSNGHWAETDNCPGGIFIYNEALIEKLCILGENVEPCFEGAQFKTDFSLSDDPAFQEFRTKMFSMMEELQNTLKEGGSTPMVEETITEPVEEEVIESQPEIEFAQKKEEEESQKEPEQKEEDNDSSEGSGSEEEEDEDKKKKYNLEEIPEYVALQKDYQTLQDNYATLEATKVALEQQVSELNEFKLAADRKDKQAMIDSFYMLTDEDKKDVVANIDSYSLDDIEAKLSIICVRNKVDFNLNAPEAEQKPDGLFSLENNSDNDVPAWVLAVRENAR